MEITINGKAHTIEQPLSLLELIDYLDIAEQRFAIEINRELIPRSTFEHYTLKPGDQIEIVGAIGGG